MANQIIKRPQMGELSSDKSASEFTKVLVNDDPVLQARGSGDLKIYTELLRDDQVASAFQQRRKAVTSSEWIVDPASEAPADVEAAEFIREQLKQIMFDDLTDKMLYAVFYGYGIAEWVFNTDGNRIILEAAKVRDRSRFRFGVDRELYLLTRQNPMGELLPREKFWTLTTGAEHDDQPYGIGLAHHLYWPVFFKRTGMKYWSVFLEKFAQPTATATLPGGQMDDPQARRRALEALDAIQVDSGVLIPEGIEITLIEAARSGTADYQSLQDAMNAAISKIILSQTMTTDNGSSLAQAEVHNDVKTEVVKGDADLLCESLNRTLIPYLTRLNFATANPPTVWRKTEPEEDLTQRVELDKGIYELGYEPTEDYIRETYGEGWVKRQAPAPMAGGDPFAGGFNFAEMPELLAKKTMRRADQETLVRAAERFAADYETIVGKRVRQLLAYAEETGDLETFRKRLNEMVAEGPSKETEEALNRATWTSRLMGRLRAQK